MGKQAKKKAAKACVLQILQGLKLPIRRDRLVDQIRGIDMKAEIVEEAIDELAAAEDLIKVRDGQVWLIDAAAASERIAEIRNEVYGS